MSILYGTKARVYGISGNIKTHAASNSTFWPTLDANALCVITGYTFTPSMAGSVEGFDQNGLLQAEAYAYANFELQINFELGGDAISNAKAIIMPTLMTRIDLEAMDNAELNGSYNFISGSVTGSNQGWKTGTMTLRKISATADSGSTSILSVISS